MPLRVGAPSPAVLARAVALAAVGAPAAALTWIVWAPPDPRVWFVLLTACGPGLLAAAPALAVAERRFRRRAVRASGTVVACRGTELDHGRPLLTVAFTALDGTSHTFRERDRWARPAGSAIEVRYDPAAPRRARLDASPAATAFLVAVVAAVGSLFTTALLAAAWFTAHGSDLPG
ncbi:DUF3592 domain-containing protein [Actinomadura atramentaria]|uniref:DUF3592 domain-containing protein n=1 Tax=Actinomadura atramentaria TaxID=1990 RepID=UPI00037C15FC|nr:DUF3592 domain-containing protein [Actinomadura atramentaria]